MWAGVFLAGDDAEGHRAVLAAVATGTTRLLVGQPNVEHPEALTAPPARRRPITVTAAPTTQATVVDILAARRRHSTLATITARSCGHCEVMSPLCRFTFDTVCSRTPQRAGRDAEDASDAYVACRPCAAAIAVAEPSFLKRLGYLVSDGYDAAFSPFWWRQSAWVFLDGGPRIVPSDRLSTPLRPLEDAWPDRADEQFG